MTMQECSASQSDGDKAVVYILCSVQHKYLDRTLCWPCTEGQGYSWACWDHCPHLRRSHAGWSIQWWGKWVLWDHFGSTAAYKYRSPNQMNSAKVYCRAMWNNYVYAKTWVINNKTAKKMDFIILTTRNSTSHHVVYVAFSINARIIIIDLSYVVASSVVVLSTRKTSPTSTLQLIPLVVTCESKSLFALALLADFSLRRLLLPRGLCM